MREIFVASRGVTDPEFPLGRVFLFLASLSPWLEGQVHGTGPPSGREAKGPGRIQRIARRDRRPTDSTPPAREHDAQTVREIRLFQAP